MNKKSIILIVFSIILLLLGVFLASYFWYHGKWKDGTGWQPVTIVVCFWALGVGILMGSKVLEYKPPYKAIFILIITIYLTDLFIKKEKYDNIKLNSQTTNAEILFIGYKYLHGFGMDYTYIVDGVKYFKWDSGEKFIKRKNFVVGDSIKVVYNKFDPHMHEFRELLYK